MADYVFRYRLDPGGEKEAVYPDPAIEMIRAQLENILNIVIPVSGQSEVRIDGFKLLRDRGRIYSLFPQGPESGDDPEQGRF